MSIKHGEIIAIGDELIAGRVLNTTSCFAADRLFNAGYAIKRITVIGDDAADIRDCLLKAVSRSSFVIISGGLGPTSDDITNQVVADTLGKKLVRNANIMRRIRECVESGRCSPDFPLDKLAMLPEGAEELDPEGYVSGYFLRHEGAVLFFLPGVPEQLREHLLRNVLPTLERINGRQHGGLKKTFRVFGKTEIELNIAMSPLQDRFREIKVGYYPNFPEVFVTLSALMDEDTSGRFEDMCQQVRNLVGEHIVAEDDETLEKHVGRLLAGKGMTLSIAESCTGGMIGEHVTRVPGSSSWFGMGVVTYSNESKIRVLGVSAESLERYGAVSASVAKEMVDGIKQLSGSDYAISVTGIAGPGGARPDKPVGTVFIGLATPEKTVSGHFLFHGKREEIRMMSAETALDWVRRHVAFGTYIPGIDTAS